MNILSLLTLMLTLMPTLVRGKNEITERHRNCMMKSLPCHQGSWKRMDNGTELSCYVQSQKDRYKKEDDMINIKGREHLHLTYFSINNEQYQLFTDKNKVILTKWSEDEERLHKVQELPIKSAYSAEVIFHDGNALLLVAVYNINEGCQQCNLQDNKNPSRAYLWDHSGKKFKKNHFQNLPSGRFVHSYPERYRNRNTVISVFTKCNCSTKIYYVDFMTESGIVFNEIDQSNILPFRDVMVVQSVRYQGTQYVLFAPLNRFDKSEAISMFKWSQTTGSLIFHRTLPTYINEDTGLSTTVFKNDVFLCSVSDASRSVTIYLVKPDRGHLEEVRHIQGDVAFSMCNLFVHRQDHELYAAVGSQRRVELLQYSPVARNFTDAGNLPSAGNVVDLVCFQSRDNTYVVTTGDCRRKRNKSRCKKNIYRRINSKPSEPHDLSVE